MLLGVDVEAPVTEKTAPLREVPKVAMIAAISSKIVILISFFACAVPMSVVGLMPPVTLGIHGP